MAIESARWKTIESVKTGSVPHFIPRALSESTTDMTAGAAGLGAQWAFETEQKRGSSGATVIWSMLGTAGMPTITMTPSMMSQQVRVT